MLAFFFTSEVGSLVVLDPPITCFSLWFDVEAATRGTGAWICALGGSPTRVLLELPPAACVVR